MASVSTWERIERRNLRRRERWRRHLRPGDRPDPSRPAGTDMLPQVKHIVVLMMENHSFDNYLGTLGRGDGFPSVRTARRTPRTRTPRAPVRAYHAPVHRAAGRRAHPELVRQPHPVGRREDDRFRGGDRAGDAEGLDKTAAMGYWTEQDLPFYHGLARTFPLADRWFSSCLGPTFPNRRFLLAGTANGLMDDLPLNLLDRPRAGLSPTC